MTAPHLYRQLLEQLRQWIVPQDQRHLQNFAEIIAAILLSQRACLNHWLPYLSHRSCQARSHLERLSYFVHNRRITAETFYAPLLRQFLQAFAGESLTLTLDTSMLWNQFCLIEVCLAWGGRSLTLAQVVLEHGSATVGFEHYRPVLEQTQRVLPPECSVTLLADRGFDHGELMRWLKQQRWHWAIRAKSDLLVTLASGRTQAISECLPPPEQAYLFHQVSVLTDIECHLATATMPSADEPWAVLTSLSPSLQTFALYGQRFGGIEPHFKDYKSAAFEILKSRLRDATALTCLVMLLDCASLLAVVLGMMVVRWEQRQRIDGHAQRGLSFLQLGLRELKQRWYNGVLLPPLRALPRCQPPPACASRRKRCALDSRFELVRVVSFSS